MLSHEALGSHWFVSGLAHSLISTKKSGDKRRNSSNYGLMAGDNALEDGLPAINKQRRKQILLYVCILHYVSFEANFILLFC